VGELVRISDIDIDTQITIPCGDQPIALSVQSVLQWLQPDAPPGEALKFLMVCRAAEVNPFLGEAHLVPMGSKWATVIDKSGWLRRAEMHPGFDGWEAGIIVQQFDPATKVKGAVQDLEGAFMPSGFVLVGGWARVYRKDRRMPIVAKVDINEYKKNSPTWTDIPRTMIRKVALVQALREAGFLTSGAYDSAEVPMMAKVTVEEQVPASLPEAIEVEFERVATASLEPAIAKELYEAIQALGMSEYDVATMLSRRGVASVVELTTSQAREILAKLHHILDQRDAGQIMLPDPKPEEADEESVEVIVEKSRAELARVSVTHDGIA
jgi:phage recombination protein Bet